MKTVRTEVTTHRSPAEAYAYLSDFANQVHWRFDVLVRLFEPFMGPSPRRTAVRYEQTLEEERLEAGA